MYNFNEGLKFKGCTEVGQLLQFYFSKLMLSFYLEITRRQTTNICDANISGAVGLHRVSVWLQWSV